MSASDAPPAASTRPGHSAPTATRRACLTCATAAPGDAAQHGWLCSYCGLVGDLGRAHPANAAIAAIASKARRGAAPDSLGSNGGGGSSSAPLSARDKQLARLAAEGGPHPAFDPALKMTAAEATEAVRQSLNGHSFVRPSDALIALIRSGKLVDVGLALPVPVFARTQDADDGDVFYLAPDGSGTVSVASRIKKAPKVESLAQFVEALCATIIPALIDMPNAIVQWMSLTRTLIQIDARYGWETAMVYCTEALHDRVPQRREFGSVASDIMANIHFSHTPSVAPSAPTTENGWGAAPQQHL